MKTETTTLIYESILHIMNEVEAIGKNKKNQQQGFMYRGIDDLYNDLQPKFAKHGVFITSEVLEEKREERQNKSGGLLLYTILRIKFTFIAKDGSSVSSIMIGEAMDSADKSANKAMSVALKYCLMQLLLIPTEELKKSDPDAYIHEPMSKTANGNVHVATTQSVKVKEELKPATPNWAKAIEYLHSQDSSIETIKLKYALSEANEKLLKAQAADQF